jgi:hypothetical protein
MPGDIATLQALRAALGAGGFLFGVVAVVVLWMILVRVLRRRGGASAPRLAAIVAMLGLWVALAGVAELTLFGTQGLGADPRLELDPLTGAWGWSGIAWRPVIDNITLFVPVGAGLAAVLPHRPVAVPLLFALALSIGVETFQWVVPSGRIANSADVVANLVGALLGVGLAFALGAAGERRAPVSPD